MGHSEAEDLLKEHPLLQSEGLRARHVEHITTAINNPRKTAIRRTKPNIRRYPLRFFKDGVWAYQYLFDNASIYYSSLAVEVGLLLKLRNLVKRKRQATPKLRITFKWLIDNSKLDEATKELAHKIRIMRNCYVHYQNLIVYIGWQHEVRWPKFVQQQKSLAYNDPMQLNAISTLEGLFETWHGEDSIPIRLEHLETTQENMDFIAARRKEYPAWMGHALSEYVTYKGSNKGGSGAILTLEEVQPICGYEAFDAHTCIDWSFKVLKALMFF